MEVMPISHHEGYFVNEAGDIFSEKYGRRVQLKQSEHKGYRRVALSESNKRTIYPVHRLVAEAFIPNPLEKPFVNHLDGNKRNNHRANLQWCTGSENQRHAYDILNIRNGKTGYKYAKLYPNEELRNRLVELGIPRWKHNLAELGEMLPLDFWLEDKRYFLALDVSGEATKEWTIGYYHQDRTPASFNDGFADTKVSDTEADARAKMLVYLIEKKIITLQ